MRKTLKKQQLGFIGALISAGAGLLGGALANKQRADTADAANALSQASTIQQMEFQERMSNTAHQREVKDLRAAGLNPILSSKYGGASTPGGASFTGQKAEVADVISPAVQNYWSAKQISSQVKNVDADTNLKGAQQRETETQSVLNEQNQLNKTQERLNAVETQRLIQTQTDHERKKIILTLNQSQSVQTRIQILKTEFQISETNLKRLQAELPGFLTEGQIDKSDYGKFLRWAGRLNPFGQAAKGVIPRPINIYK